MRKKLFIGCSHQNGLVIAKKLKKRIEEKCQTWLDVHIWDDGTVFTLSKSFLQSLIDSSRKFDFGIFIATNDDELSDKNTTKIPRDNVIFEMGLFLGSMGITRSFLLVEEKTKLPSDFNGITVPFFNKEDDDNLTLAIDKIIDEVVLRRNTYNIKIIPSTALAQGYFENFLLPFATNYKERIDKNLPDNITLNIILPSNLAEKKDKSSFNKVIDDYQDKYDSEDIGVFEKGKRPTIKRLNSDNSIYWDVPTTLITLAKLFEKISPNDEYGLNLKTSDWINNELLNFKGFLEDEKKKYSEFRQIDLRFFWYKYEDKHIESEIKS